MELDIRNQGCKKLKFAFLNEGHNFLSYVGIRYLMRPQFVRMKKMGFRGVE